MASENDYLVLSNGQRVRFEVNLNSLADFAEKTGISISDLSGPLTSNNMAAVRTFIHCCVVEGEQNEGREFPETEIELASKIRLVQVKQAMSMLTSQVK